MAETPKTDRLGVSKLDHFFSAHGWLFREQFPHDFGIDAQVEVVLGGQPTGALIGIQIKSGPSYFSEETKTGFIYRAKDRHVSYWAQHVLPVIVVLYCPVRDECYWERISADTLLSTRKSWRLEIPKSNLLSKESLSALRNLTQPPPYLQKLNKLRLDTYWMFLLAQGETIYVEFEDWINKSLPRFQLRIGCASRDDIVEETWPTTYGIGFSIKDALSHLLPWADYEMDLAAYVEYMQSVWHDECYSWYDKETDTTFYSRTFEEWYEPPDGLLPVHADGEVERYRLLLSLNELGKAFVSLDAFLSGVDELKNRAVTLEES